MPATDVRRTDAELQDAARRMAANSVAVPEVQGARAALEWLAGLTEDAPITAGRLPVEGNLLREANAASMAAMGIGSCDRAYASGADAILMWAAGVVPVLPGWLRATV